MIPVTLQTASDNWLVAELQVVKIHEEPFITNSGKYV